MAFTLKQTGIAPLDVQIGMCAANPASSGRAIVAANPTAPSGWYWISWPGLLGGMPALTYIDMTGAECGSSVGGWMRIDDRWFARHTRILQYQVPGVYPSNTTRWTNGSWGSSPAAGSRFFQQAATDGVIRCLKIVVPTGSRGIRVRKLRVYSYGGADWPSWNDSVATNPSNAQIISAGEGTAVGLGSNYSSFGIYFGNSSGTGVRPYKTSAGDYPTGSEAPYGGFVTLTNNSFNQFDDIGTDADRLIWYETDGNTEYEYLYNWTFWIR